MKDDVDLTDISDLEAIIESGAEMNPDGDIWS